MKRISKSLIFLGVLCLVSHTVLFSKGEKHVIGGRAAGFFSNFLAVLNHLHWCQKVYKTPVVYWPKDGLYYDPRGCNGIVSDNIWDYYFYPVSDLSYVVGDKLHFSPNPPEHFAVATHPFTTDPYPVESLRRHMNDLIKEYIKIKPQTLNKIEDFYAQNIENKYTVSIHIRATDKYLEVRPVSLDRIFDTANKHVPCQFFVATDDERVLNEAKKRLNGPVISYDSCRVNRVNGVHNSNYSCSNQSRAYLGEEALIDCILLSRCNRLIHTWSNLSIAALLFNPDLEHIHLE